MICTIVPVKSLSLAKGRLANILTAAERQALVKAMLEDVLAALRATLGIDRVSVVSPDADVLALAVAAGAAALRDEAGNLNGALVQAAQRCDEFGASTLLVLPADIPLVTPSEIAQLIASRGGARGVALVPARDGGTNALLVWPPLVLPFLFGPGSLVRHLEVARQRGVDVQLFHARGLELDVDRPDDLFALASSPGATAAQRLVRELNICARLACV